MVSMRTTLAANTRKFRGFVKGRGRTDFLVVHVEHFSNYFATVEWVCQNGSERFGEPKWRWYIGNRIECCGLRMVWFEVEKREFQSGHAFRKDESGCCVRCAIFQVLWQGNGFGDEVQGRIIGPWWKMDIALQVFSENRIHWAYGRFWAGIQPHRQSIKKNRDHIHGEGFKNEIERQIHERKTNEKLTDSRSCFYYLSFQVFGKTQLHRKDEAQVCERLHNFEFLAIIWTFPDIRISSKICSDILMAERPYRRAMIT